MLMTSSFASMEVCNQLKEVFNFIDANGDGKVSSFELTEVLLCLGHKEEYSLASKEAEEMVKEMDSNGDGLIDFDEFMGVVYDRKGEDDSLRDAFLIFDSDKNGKISAKELQKVLLSLGCESCSLDDCKLMIRGVDRDGDGFVDFEEFNS